MSKTAKCLVPDCKSKRYSRGCCAACLISFRRQVKSGKVTWAELIRAGVVLPAHVQRIQSNVAYQAVDKINLAKKKTKC